MTVMLKLCKTCYKDVQDGKSYLVWTEQPVCDKTPWLMVSTLMLVSKELKLQRKPCSSIVDEHHTWFSRTDSNTQHRWRSRGLCLWH